jgi:hypothetical protein
LFLRIALATVALANTRVPGFGLLHAQRATPAASSSAVNTVLHPQLLQLLQVVVVVGQVLHGLLQHFSASALPMSLATIPIVMLHNKANDITLFIVYPFF